MGRKLKYKTYEQQLEAKRRWRREWYGRNRKQVCKKYMQRYYAQKEMDTALPEVPQRNPL